MIRTLTRRVISVAAIAIAAGAAVPAMSARADAQAPAGLQVPAAWLQGYVKAVAGDSIVYPWAYPGQTKTLLSRTTDGAMRVAWIGEPVPAGAAADPVTYLWHAGTASGYGAHAFTLALNGRPVATFRSGRTADDREWQVAGAGGATLAFQTTRVGTFNELFGFMWITAPRALFGPGSPEFSVTGEAAGSQDYYLGPQERVQEYVRVRPEEAVFAGGERAIRLETSSVGGTHVMRVDVDGALTFADSGAGYRTVLLKAGPNTARNLNVRVTTDGAEVFAQALSLSAVTPRTLHLLPHSHVDIGYSDPQPDVERKQWRNLRDAVELGRKTASYPVEARFRWNVEGLWSVESYLAQADADERRAFVDAVRQGTIGLQANDTNILTGLATPDELRHWTDGARRLKAAYGIGPALSAMHTDIPGLSWPVVAALAQAGVRYFSSGPNYMPGLPDGGDRIGSTLKALGDRPFWWASPSGEERLLFWMAGRGYSWFHGLNMGRMTERSRDDVLAYVKALAENGYPYDMVQVRYTIGGDNGPVDPALPEAVKTWNETFATPRLAINTADAMFAEFERRHGAGLPVYSGDMTPYWEDGAISSAAEEIMARAAARRLTQADALWAMRNPAAYPAAQAADAWRNLILWHEHTWGAADSISHPDRADVVGQWQYKRAFAVNADAMSRTLMAGAAPAAGPEIEIVNTLGWPRSGLVMLPAEQSRAGDRVRTREGQTLASQRLRDGRLAVWVDAVPALASTRLRVEPGRVQAPREAITFDGVNLDTGSLRVQVDSSTGGIARLAWRAPGVKIVSKSQSPEPRAPLSTSGGGPRPPTTPIVGRTWQPGAGQGDVALNSGPVGQYFYVAGRDPSQASGRTGGRMAVVESGPLVTILSVDGPAPGTDGVRQTAQLVGGSDDLLLTVEVTKTSVRTKESAHVAFPLSIAGGVVRVDLGDAVVRPDDNQLPGSCRDFIGAHGVVDVSGQGYGVSVATLDAPLIEVGAITDERQNDRGTRGWRDRTAPGTTLFAYLLNNYWHTNYKAEQQGLLSYRFVVRPHGAFDPVALGRFSEEQDQPLLVFAADPAAPMLQSPFRIESTSVLVAALAPAEGGRALAVRLYNPADVPAGVTVRPSMTGTRVMTVGADGVPVELMDGTLTLRPRATRTVRLVLPTPPPRR
jgi:alpha-mannosidase